MPAPQLPRSIVAHLPKPGAPPLSIGKGSSLTAATHPSKQPPCCLPRPSATTRISSGYPQRPLTSPTHSHHLRATFTALHSSFTNLAAHGQPCATTYSLKLSLKLEGKTKCRSSTLEYGCILRLDRADPNTRVRTLTGKEIELDIEADYKVHLRLPTPSYGLAATLPYFLSQMTTRGRGY